MLYMKKLLSCLLAAASVFGFCAFSYTSSAAEVSEQQSVQESAEVSEQQSIQESTEAKDTELVFIIDKSGSMSGLKSDTIGNFNSVINEQKKDTENGKVYVTTVMFNQIHSKVHDREDIASIAEMTDSDYIARGSTALLDAVGDTLTDLSKAEGIKERNVVVAIITDGYENCSKKYSKDQVKEIIESCEKDGWKILFFGAGVDAFSDKSGAGLGIRKDRLWTVDHSRNGVDKAFGCVSDIVRDTRTGK